MEGVSGPGVGSASRVVQAGWVGTMMFVGSTILVDGAGVLDIEQADNKKSRKMKDESLKLLDVFMIFIFESLFEVARRMSSGRWC